MATDPSLLQNILQKLALPLAQGGLSSLGNAMQAQGNPLAFQQAQENQRQTQQLQQAHQQFLSNLALHQQEMEQQQENFGATQEAQEQNRKDSMNRWLLTNSSQIAPAKAGEPGAVQLGSSYYKGIKPQADEDLVTLPDSILSQLGIQPTGQKVTTHIDKVQGLLENIQKEKDKKAQLAANTSQLAGLQSQAMNLIAHRFAPEHYVGIYGVGKTDPEAKFHADDFTSQIMTAATKDRASGNSTQMEQALNRLNTFQSDWEKMQIAKMNKDQGVSQRIQEHADTRADKSYQFTSSEMDKLSNPVDQAAARFSRLQDTVNQVTPQADALIAPELLSVMAGGPGSGVRMNEAEIARIVGGRTNWESLKAAVNKWQLDPSKGLSITLDQRNQVRKLIAQVGDKINKKQSILTDARQQLVDHSEDDPITHRQIMAKALKSLSDLDKPTAQDQLGVRPPLVVPPPPR